MPSSGIDENCEDFGEDSEENVVCGEGGGGGGGGDA